MRKTLLPFVLPAILLHCVTLLAGDKTPQQKYIETWAATAVREMHRAGIPASITLAQGLLESGAGQSDLALKGNNHFGIKCHSGWKGRSMTHDDDARGECFRAYDSGDESFRDHSDFLRHRDRYRFLFDLDVTDYKAWAYGLKKAGYATNPNYATLLIKYIEDYELYKYDLMDEIKVEELPKSRKSIEAPGLGANPTLQPAIDLARHNFYKVNGVNCVNSVEGDSFSSLSEVCEVSTKKLLKHNDKSRDETVEAGVNVFLKHKKRQGPKGVERHVVESADESLWGISQRYGVKLKSIKSMNSLPRRGELEQGDVVYLRKKAGRK